MSSILGGDWAYTISSDATPKRSMLWLSNSSWKVCSDILGFEILVRSTYGLFLSDIEGEVKLTEMYEWAPPQSFADPLSLRSKLKVVERWNKANDRREQKKKGGGATRGKGGAKA